MLDPNIIADKISAEIDSNKSAAYPAQSPTLSPTKSAMTAGFLGSSSGIPYIKIIYNRKDVFKYYLLQLFRLNLPLHQPLLYIYHRPITQT